MRKALSELTPISIRDINLQKIIISKCGEHNDDPLDKTVEKKLQDLHNCNYCYWAHGNLNPAHTRKFCETWISETKKAMYVLMPIGISTSTKESKKSTFSEWFDGTKKEKMPSCMKPVTGAPGSNRAFVFDALYYLKETVDFRELYKHYYPVNYIKCDKPPENACGTMSRCSNKCLKIKNDSDINLILEEFKEINDKYSVIVGRLKEPYHVELFI